MNSSAGEFKHSIYSRNLPFFGIGSDAYFCSVLVDNLFILMLTFTSTKKLYKSMVAKQRCKQFCNSSMTLKNILEYFNIFALLSFISKVIILIFYCFIVYWPIFFIRKNFRERNLPDVWILGKSAKIRLSKQGKFFIRVNLSSQIFFQTAICENKYSKKSCFSISSIVIHSTL